MTNTAISAKNSPSIFEGQITGNITFKDSTHEKFYRTYLPKCREQDVYQKALIYCLGISADTRNNIERIYDFKSGNINPECLYEGWITSGSARVIRMAYNLYYNDVPIIGDNDDVEKQLAEYKHYTVEDLFYCGYAPYFWEAIKIRYPEFC